MTGTRQGRHDPEEPRFKAALTRCLVDGDPETVSRARRARRQSVGVSLAIETSILGLLVTAPLLTSVAKLQLHQVPPPQLAFFGEWHEHSPVQHEISPRTAHTEISDPYPQPPVLGVGARSPHAEEPEEVPPPEISVGDVPGAVAENRFGQMPPVEPSQIAQRRSKTNVP
jgi:hypothetical protein